MKEIRNYIAEDNEKSATKRINEIYSRFENIPTIYLHNLADKAEYITRVPLQVQSADHLSMHRPSVSQ